MGEMIAIMIWILQGRKMFRPYVSHDHRREQLDQLCGALKSA